MIVLVTGATGFIGSRLTARLLAEGAAVRALVLPEEPTDWGDLVDVRRGDIADPQAIRAAVAGAGTIFHLAAVVSDWGAADLHRRITVGGTQNILAAAAAERARVILVSSVVVYGDALRRDVCHEDHPPGRPLGAYSRSKQEQERLAWEAAAKGLPVTVVRPTNVYGPGSKPWVHDAVAQLRSGLPSLIGGGRGNAGLCHVDNLVDALWRAAATPAAVGRAYNVSDGSDVTWARYFSDLARLSGAPAPRSIPWPLAKTGAYACEAIWRLFRVRSRPPLTHEALNLVGSDHRVPIDRARAELGYAPQISYEEGIASVAAYLSSRSPSPPPAPPS